MVETEETIRLLGDAARVIREIRHESIGEDLTDDQLVELLNAPLYDGPASQQQPVTIKMYDLEAYALLGLVENTKLGSLGINHRTSYQLTGARRALLSALRLDAPVE
jgi:hypothetical protein